MMKKIQKLLRQRDDEGQGLVEYGLILGLIAVVAIAALNATGTNVNLMLQRVANTLDTVS
ncbi:MAG: Flp family type IVb pilin [Candidatus Riflebacteria bacterium]|nr:Flp family type IVb pilin [Candidatus Riflebacteria bacterium]